MSSPVALGETRYLGSNLVSAEAIDDPNHLRALSLHVSDIRVEVVADSADADIEVLRCVLAADGPGPSGDESGHSKCASLSPFTSGNLRLGFKRGDDDIVVAVTLRKHGEVRIAGLQVRYSSGRRHGTQHVGVQAIVRSL
jgi:hypothetical protein